MDLSTTISQTPLQEVKDELIEKAGVRLFIKRDDLIHPEISGNKWRKLKYNILEAQKKRAKVLLTFGGAYSNHLYAVASVGHSCGISTIGIVRGDELNPTSSPTLRFCLEKGMQLYFVSRQEYREKEEGKTAANLINESVFVIPEGGSNTFALPGVQEMVREVASQLARLPDYFAIAGGTGGTAAGILSAGVDVVCFPVLKGGDFLKQDIDQLLKDTSIESGRLKIETDYHFGGYGKYDKELLDFIKNFEVAHQVPLEQVYTGKLFFGLYDLIKKGYFERNTIIVAVHTGGLQGRLPELDS